MSDTKYSVKSGFYDAINHDRLYSADDMNQPYKSMLSAGIIEGGFEVTPQSTPDMTVNVAAGHALLGDKWVDAAAKTLTVPENTALYGRIDAVVLRVDINTGVRAADLIYRTGTPASEPEAPALIGTTGIYEVRLANITVAAGATAIAAAQISDQRGTSGCPYVTMTVGNTQIKAAVEDVLEAHPEWTTTVEDGSITLQKLASGVIDSTLKQAGAAADAKVTGDAIADLNNDLGESFDLLTTKTKNYYIHNIFDSVSFEDGAINLSGVKNSTTSYKYSSPIKVSEGDFVRVDSAHEARYVTAYKDGVANASLGAEYTSKYVVPANVDAIIMTFGNVHVPADTIELNSQDIVPLLSDYWVSTNLLDNSKITPNKYCNKSGNTGDSSVYSFTDYIYVNEGEVIKGFYATEYSQATNDTFKYVTAYDDNKSAIPSSGAEEVTAYTVPNGVACVRITMYNSRLALDNYQIVKNSYYPYTPYKKELTPNGVGENGLALLNLLKKPLTTLPSYVVNALSYRPVGRFTKPYLCLTSDDGSHELASYTIPMLIAKDIPATLYLMKSSEVFTDATETQTVVDAITNSGFELGQHGGRSWITDESALSAFFDSETAFFDSLNITAKSGACPAGFWNPMVDVLVGGRFGVHRHGYGATENLYYPYYLIGERCNLFGLPCVDVLDYSLQENKDRLDYAIAHNLIYCVYWHDNRFTTELKQMLEDFIDYAKAQNVDFCTVSEIATLTQDE